MILSRRTPASRGKEKSKPEIQDIQNHTSVITFWAPSVLIGRNAGLGPIAPSNKDISLE